jgi:eukaryotic-like serine/threonine-protein kinase
MSLAPDTRIGPYVIVAPLGAGGMGEVYRARDTVLNRDVAIKVLPDAFLADGERLARFEREARTLAALNHPHIAQIYGVEASGASRALVMELVEGEDLAARLRRGPMPVEEAVAAATQIAEALEAAHELGIVHRDLKPANVKLRKDGAAKVLDFGLAKALDVNTAIAPGASLSPTVTSPAMTAGGILLGTAAYMSPEQAKGRAVDRRSDIWAFGAVVYEMLTAKRLFDGDGVAETLARVIEREPDLTALPRATPASVRWLLQRCLTKDVRRRLQSIGEARVALSGGWDGRAGGLGVSANQTHGETAVSRVQRWTAGGAVVVGALVAGGLLGTTLDTPPHAAPPEPIVVEVPTATSGAGFAVSPDGRHLAYVDVADGVRRLHIRTLAEARPRVVTDSVEPDAPFWSPDSASVGYFQSNELRRFDLAGGASRRIVLTGASPQGQGASWSTRDEIAYSAANDKGIQKVRASGGTPEPLVPNDTEAGNAWPVWLPDGERLLYLRAPRGDGLNGAIVVFEPGKEPRQVVSALSRFAVTADHLVWADAVRSVAVSFDTTSATTRGEPFTLVDNVNLGVGTPGRAIHAVPTVLAMRQYVGARTRLVWFDRTGAQSPAIDWETASTEYTNVSLSRRGDVAAFNNRDERGRHVWLADFVRGSHTRMTFEDRGGTDPIFAPDGQSLAYHSGRTPAGIYTRRIAGNDPGQLLAAESAPSIPRDWSPDGRTILFVRTGDIFQLPVDRPDNATPYITSPLPETDAKFSPDGRRVAYVSQDRDHQEVFVQDFPPSGAKWQVSAAGGQHPRWHPNGRELFFMAPDGALMSVSVDPDGPGLRFGRPRVLFTVPNSALIEPSRRYGVAADGSRFLMNLPAATSVPPITLFVNWQQSLLASARPAVRHFQ